MINRLLDGGENLPGRSSNRLLENDTYSSSAFQRDPALDAKIAAEEEEKRRKAREEAYKKAANLRAEAAVLGEKQNFLTDIINNPVGSFLGEKNDDTKKLRDSITNVAVGVKEMITPSRGFSEEELRGQDLLMESVEALRTGSPLPSASKDKLSVKGALRIVPEFIDGIGSLAEGIVSSQKEIPQEAFDRFEILNSLADWGETIKRLAVPETVEEARSMRLADVADLAFGTVLKTSRLSRAEGEVVNFLIKNKGNKSLIAEATEELVTNHKMSDKLLDKMVAEIGEEETLRLSRRFRTPTLKENKQILQFVDEVSKERKGLSEETTGYIEDLSKRFGLNPNQKNSALAEEFRDILTERKAGIKDLERKALNQADYEKAVSVETKELKTIAEGSPSLKTFIDNAGSRARTKKEMSELYNKVNGLNKKVENLAKKTPAEAAGVFAGFGEDEEGNFEYKIERAVMVMGAMHGGKTMASKSKTIAKLKALASEKALGFREAVQDSWIRVKKITDDPEAKIGEMTPYEVHTQRAGRQAARQEDAMQAVESVIANRTKEAKSLKITDDELREKVNTYMVARHTPERNAVVGEKSTGYSTEEAEEILSTMSKGKDFKSIEKIAAQMDEMNQQTLEILKDGQIITDELYKDLRTKYKHHVPLQRIMDDVDVIDGLTGGAGASVKSTGIYTAKGSEREVSDLLGNIEANLQQSIIMAEKNRVNLSLLRFNRENEALGVFKEFKSKAIGKDFKGNIIKEKITDPDVIHIFEKGKKRFLQVTDKKVASAINGTNVQRLPKTLEVVGQITRLMSGMVTRFNPEFVMSNKIRDVEEMAVFMASEDGVSAFSTIGKQKDGFVGVIDGLRGKDTELGRLYQQMRMDGGTTGGMALSTKENVVKSMDEIKKINDSKTRTAAKKVLKAIDNWNTVFEDSTRLSVYKEALEKGFSRDKAAVLAKEATLNFDKKGTVSPIFNSLYMFSNASVQGSAKLLHSMKNPKVAAAVVTSVVVPVFAANNMNDTIDPEWRDKVTEWDRKSNLVIVLPGSDKDIKYITIPVSWGLKPIKVMADASYDAMQGKGQGLAKNTADLVSATLDAYNPVGGTDAWSTLVPTIGDVPSEIIRNQKWSGGLIKPDWMKLKPETEQRFSNTGDSLIGEGAILGTEALRASTGIDISPENVLYAYKQYTGGIGAFGSKITNVIAAAGNQDAIQLRDVPFVGRFVKDRTEEQIGMALKYSDKAEFEEDIKKYKTDSPEQKEFIKTYLLSLPDDQTRANVLFSLNDGGINTKGLRSNKEMILMEPVYEKVELFMNAGDRDSAASIINKLDKNEVEVFKKVRSAERAKSSTAFKKVMNETPEETIKYLKALPRREATRLIENLDDEEIKVLRAIKDNQNGR